MSDVDLSVIKKTQDTLGKFVKKPPLSDKLLKRPPFRFLHDIVNVIVKDTGYLKGLYSDVELISDNIKDRDAKIKFLQSLIDVVKISTGEPLMAKPSKIVAGQEPDKTNELLQAIARAVENNVDSNDAVDTVKHGKTKAKPVTENTSVAKPEGRVKKVANDSSKIKKVETGKSITTSQSNAISKIKEKPDKVGRQKVETKMVKPPINGKIPKVDKNIENKSRTKDKQLVRKSSSNDVIPKLQIKPPGLIENQIDNALGPEVPDIIPVLLPTPSPVSIPIVDEPKPKEPLTPKDNSKSESRRSISNTNSLEPLKTFRNSTDELSAIIDEEAERRRTEKPKMLNNNSPRPNTSENHDSLSEFEKEEKRLAIESEVEKKTDDLSPPVPSPALKNGLKKPNKVVNETVNPTLEKQKSYIKEPLDEQKNARPRTSLRPPSVRPASARPGAPRRRDKNVEIVLQPDELVKLGEINVKVESFNAEMEDDGENLIVIEDVGDPTTDLMFKTVGDKTAENAQGHLVQQILDTQKEFSTVTMNNTSGNDDGTEISSQRLASAKQINSLRDALQKLTRAVNPLGKLFDFLQEDIDAMEREFDTWKENYKQTKILINREKGLTENAIEPMKHQLAQIDLNIKEHIEMINSSRANILQNEQKIFKLLIDI